MCEEEFKLFKLTYETTAGSEISFAVDKDSGSAVRWFAMRSEIKPISPHIKVDEVKLDGRKIL